MFNEDDEFDDCNGEPPSFVAGGSKEPAGSKRKIGVSAGVGSPFSAGLHAGGIDSRAGDVSGLAGDLANLNLRSAGPAAAPQPFQNPANLPQDDVFDYDPGFQEDPNQPFTESDIDDDEDEDASSTNDHSFGEEEGEGSSSSKQAALFSTSVPINVPQLTNYHRHRQQHDHNHDHRGTDSPAGAVPVGGRREMMGPDDMAASIQALARSVHADKSEMVFGELPKSRTHISRTLSAQPSSVAPPVISCAEDLSSSIESQPNK